MRIAHSFILLAWLSCVLTSQASAAVEKDTRSWQRRGTSGPGNRSWSSMAHDGGGKLISLSTDSATNSQPRTWEYDLQTGVWTEHVRTPSPPMRGSYGLAYSSHYKMVVLFGGSWGDRLYNDLWAYDVTTGRWEDVSPALGDKPSPRHHPAWAYDENRAVFVMHGGAVAGPGGLNSNAETWEWDRHIWRKKQPDSNDMQTADIVYMPTRKQVVAIASSGSVSAWDGTSWLPTDHNTAALAENAALVYAGSGRLLAFGGVEGGVTSSNSMVTWESNGTTWLRVTTPQSPSARVSPMLAYDPTGGRVVLSGGLSYFFDNKTPPIYPADTWEYQVTALDNGSPCAVDQADRCQSRSCVDGVCCASACGGNCEICNQRGQEGMCTRELSATCPAPMTGTGGAPGAGGMSGAGGTPVAPPDAGNNGNGGAGGSSGGNGGGGGSSPTDVPSAVDANIIDMRPPGGDGPGASPSPPKTPVRGHYAGSACAFAPGAPAPGAWGWLALAVLVGLRRRRRTGR